MHRNFWLASVALAALIGLTGCSTAVVSATPTPVAFKACMLGDDGGFTDGGINQDAYFGLQQSQAQFGVHISQISLQATDSSLRVRRLVNRLVSRQCNLIISIGDKPSSAMFNAAQRNPKIQFVQLDSTPLQGESVAPQNLSQVVFNTDVANFEAGYLAAAESTTKVVGVIGAEDSLAAKRGIWYFRQGAQYFAKTTGAAIVVAGAPTSMQNTWHLINSNSSAAWVKDNVRAVLASGADVLMPFGVNGLAAAQEVSKISGSLIIGSDSDWFAEPRYATVKSIILASVQKQISGVVVQLVSTATAGGTATPTASTQSAKSPVPASSGAAASSGVGASSGAPAASVSQGVVSITASHDVGYPAGIDAQFASIAAGIANGTISVDPYSN